MKTYIIIASVLITIATIVTTSCTSNNQRNKTELVKISKTDTSKLHTVEYPQSEKAKENPTTIDLKTLKEGETINVEFAIKNVGKKNLLIRNVVTGCGCTEVTYERKPIKPGDTSIAKLKFDSKGQWGTQLKTIEIISTDYEIILLKLKAEVN